MNPDFVDLLRAFIEGKVRFLIVGAYRNKRETGRAKDLGDIEGL